MDGTPAWMSAASWRPMWRTSSNVSRSPVLTLWVRACAYAWESQKTTVVTATRTAMRVVSSG